MNFVPPKEPKTFDYPRMKCRECGAPGQLIGRPCFYCGVKVDPCAPRKKPPADEPPELPPPQKVQE